VHDELQTAWREDVLAYSRYYPRMFLKGMRKTTNNIRVVGVLAEVQTEYLVNTILKRYRFTNLLSNIDLE
jgi:hypothetical protein